MRAAIYRRVSSAKQGREDKYSLPEQEEKTRAYCKEKGYEVVADFGEIYSGAELETRPKINDLLDMVRKQQVDVVVLTNLDRLSRDQTHQVVLIYEIERKYRAKVELTEETYEDSPQGSIIRTFAGFYAEMERQKIMERTSRGKQQRVRQGLMMPGNLPLYGYSWADEKKSRYVINPVTSPVAIRIWNEAAKGVSVRKIAVALTEDQIDCPRDAWRREKADPKDPPRGGCWVYSTVHSILYNPAYWGEHSAYRWNMSEKRTDKDPINGMATRHTVIKQRTTEEGRIMLPDAAPPLVSKELATIVHERLARNKLEATRRNRNLTNHLLRAGYAKCGVCHGNMTASTYTDGEPRYNCHNSLAVARQAGRCTNKNSIMAVRLDTEVWASVMTVLQDPEYFEKQMTQEVDEDRKQDAIEGVQHRLAQLQQQQKSLRRFMREMQGDEGAELLLADFKLVSKQKKSAEAELERLQQSALDVKIARDQMRSLAVMIHGIIQAGNAFTYEEKRTILYMLNIRVDIFPKDRVPRYEVTGGRHGEMKLPLATGSDCDRIVQPIRCTP